MICILAGNYLEAQRYADSQYWSQHEWFYPTDELDLMRKNNFHVLVIGTAGHNVPPRYFEKIYALARERGKIGRF
jgi:hypothetical protein